MPLQNRRLVRRGSHEVNVYRLWTGEAPGAQGSTDADIPTLTDVGAAGATAQPSCIVCPGGAYAGLADHEGAPVAEWLEKIGVRGFVLKYRLGPKYHHPVMMHDAERAIRFVRSMSKDLGVDPEKVGIMGFSAGGHLASTVSTHNSEGDPNAVDLVDRQSSRPDWSVLIYPVISMKDPYTHAQSREMLLGKNPDPKAIEDLSNAEAVSLSTPPTFLCHGSNDTVVPVENSLQYATALSGHKISFKLYVPMNGPHGFGMGGPGTERDWTGMCQQWLRDRRIL